VIPNQRGTPQGGVISPLLANLSCLLYLLETAKKARSGVYP
jgi:retron-type reverse transcriptase